MGWVYFEKVQKAMGVKDTTSISCLLCLSLQRNAKYNWWKLEGPSEFFSGTQNCQISSNEFTCLKIWAKNKTSQWKEECKPVHFHQAIIKARNYKGEEEDKQRRKTWKRHVHWEFTSGLPSAYFQFYVLISFAPLYLDCLHIRWQQTQPTN